MAGNAGLPRVGKSRIVAGGAIAVVIGGIVAAASVNPGDAGPTAHPFGPVTDLPSDSISLVAFDSCETALSGLRRAAWPYIGPYGFGGGVALSTRGGGAIADAVPGAAAAPGAPAPQMPKREAAQDSAGAGQSGGRQNSGHSGTNTHESGVDEPDVVKTDGKRIVSVVDGKLKVIDVASRKITGTLDVPDLYVSQMLISGDRALLVAAQDRVVHDMPTPGGPPDVPMPTPRGKPGPGIYPGMGSKLVLVDLVGTPRVLGSLAVDGLYVDARQVGSVARVVVRSQPRLRFAYPDGTQSDTASLEQNREIVRQSSIDDWLPRYQLDVGDRTSGGRLVDCNRVSHPADYSGTGMLTVLTVDLTKALDKGDPVTVAADGDTVYGTDKSLYVADDHTSRIVPMMPMPRGSVVPDRPRQQPGKTQIHRFDIAGAGPPKYAGSGEVEGMLLNQYSLSEHNGHLRVATTVGAPGGFVDPGSPGQSQSMVTVLARGDKSLTQVGRVDGLGKGERIYAVRFYGDVGYVVTFRQVDPLYTLDLSEPARPRVVGELKITGYSAYLHPVGQGKVLGVGQEATEQGRRLGSQVSLFDVGNPATPNRLAQQQIEGGSSEVEYDPHAFLYWPARNLVVVPVMTGKPVRIQESSPQPQNYALVLRLDGNAIVEAGRVSHPTGMIRRSLVIGDELWTVSDAGLMASDLDRLGQRAWIPLR